MKLTKLTIPMINVGTYSIF